MIKISKLIVLNNLKQQLFFLVYFIQLYASSLYEGLAYVTECLLVYVTCTLIFPK